MAASTDVNIRLKVEGATQGAHDLAAVDAQLQRLDAAADKGAASFGRFTQATSVAHVNRLKAAFADTGIAVETSSRHVTELVERMERAARNDAFARLGREARLSTLQIARLRAGMGDTRGAMSTLGQGIAASRLAILAWTAALGYALKSCMDAQIQLQRLDQSYRAVFGESAPAQLQAVYEQTDRVGLKYAETAEAAKSFFAAGQGTGLASQMQGIFRAVTNAGAALQLSTDDINGTFIALGQMISKGKVQAEELRGQLGERLPGAFQMAAKAMGMTTAELDKFMADGKLTAEDLLPKLARALEEQYGRAAQEAADTVQGSINRMESEWTRFKAGLLASGPAVFTIKFITETLKAQNDLDAQRKEIAEIDAELAKRGVKPEGPADYDSFSGVTISGRRYSDQQRENIRNERAATQAKAQTTRDAAQEREKASARGQASYIEAVKGTKAYKLKQAKQDRERILKDIQDSIKAAKDEGARPEVIVDLKFKYDEAKKALDDKIAAIQDKADKAGKAAGSAATRAAVSQADYTGEVERTRQKIDSLQQQLGLDRSEDLTKAKIEIERRYQAEISKTREELAKGVARGSLTQAQADALGAQKNEAADLERQLALKEAQAKADEKARKSLQVRADFYTELARLSGNYGESLEYQVQLIEKQAADWVLAGISLDDVNRRAALMRQELSHDAFAGLARGARKFGADYGDVAAQVESLTTQMGSHISNTLADAFMRGKFSAQDFFSSLVGMAAQAASNAFIGKIFGGLGSLFSFGGADAVTQSSVSGATSVINQGIGVAAAMRHAGGLADASGGARRVPLAAFVHAPRFHGGGGIFGPDEYPAVLLRGERVLNREETRAYDARMAAPVYAPSAQAPQVNINIDNRTGAEVEAQGQARPDGNGGFTLDIMLAQVEQGLVTRAKSGKSQLFQYQETAYGLGRAAVLARGRGRA